MGDTYVPYELYGFIEDKAIDRNDRWAKIYVVYTQFDKDLICCCVEYFRLLTIGTHGITS